MFSGISIICFAASYAVALCLEFSRLFFRVSLRTAVMVGFVVAGLVAHSLYLSREAHQGLAAGAPLSSWYHGCLLIAWLLAAAYVVFSLWRTPTAVGLLVLPTILALVAVAQLFPKQPQLSSAQAYRVWSLIHGFALLLGTAAVVVGFLAGVMYLAQSYRLKHKMIRPRGLRLPSLERLQQLNEGALVASSCLLLAGLVSGILLNLIHHIGDTAVVPWTDPVVWTSGGLLSWVVIALIFNAFYKPARRGRKVAYLTVASFVFLGLELAIILLVPSAHVAPRINSDHEAAANPMVVICENGNPTRERGITSLRGNPSLTLRVTITTAESRHGLAASFMANTVGRAPFLKQRREPVLHALPASGSSVCS